MNFCHIIPTKMLPVIAPDTQNTHLLLAHLIENDHRYREWYQQRRITHPDSFYHMDNSCFEMYKQGRPYYSPEKLLDTAEWVKPDTIVMSDYPGERGSKTIAAAQELAPVFKQAGYQTFFVPQSEVGDYEDYIQTFAWAAWSPLVDWIGVSILGVPNAYGVERDNKLQRFLSRWRMLSELRERGILRRAVQNGKKLHCLGCLDGYRELELLNDFPITTWDSSAAAWYGLNGIAFDNSPTGSINGKYEKEVDFDFYTDDPMLISTAKKNIQLIDGLCF